MIEGILADNLFDFILGGLTGWLLASGGSKKRTGGIVVIVFYAMSTIGVQLDAEYVTVGAAVHVIAYLLGGALAFGITKR